MADVKNAVWKYPIPDGFGTLELDMPAGARVVDVQLQHGVPVMWAVVDPDAPPTKRVFGVIATGTALPFRLGKHLGTFQLFDGETVLHVFDHPTGNAAGMD